MNKENGLASDGLEIPKSLRLKADASGKTMRKPPTAAEKAKIDAAMAKGAPAASAASLRVPKDLDAEGAAMLEALKAPKVNISAARPKKEPKRASREGLITVASIAKEYGMIPRVARACLRAAKLTKPAAGWAFDAKDPALAKVREVLKAGVPAKETKETSSPKKAKATVPPPAETVWSGKAKKAKASKPAPVVGEKEKARAEIKSATKKPKK